MGTWLVGIVIAAIVVAVIVKLVRNHQQGKGSCSCGCSGCAKSCGVKEEKN